MLRKELKESFLRELTPSEKTFFLKKARDAIIQNGYPAGEDLFHYCYFLTLRKRMRGIRSTGAEGYTRFLLVESSKDIEDSINIYRERLEKNRRSVPDPAAAEFIEYFS